MSSWQGFGIDLPGEGEVATAFGPFVVLFGQHRSHQAPGRRPVGDLEG